MNITDLLTHSLNLKNDIIKLEWAVRKTISIPKKYYWETGNYNVSTKVKIWHRTVQALGKGLHATEAVGGFFVHILGLDSSRLSYVTDFMTEEEWEQAYRTKEEDQGKRDLVQEILKNQEMHRV